MDNINAAFYAWVRHMRVNSLQTGGEMYQMLVSENATVYDRTAKLFYHPTKSLALTSYDIEEFGLEGMGEFQLDPRYINGLSATPAPKTCFGSFVPANPDHGLAYILVPDDGKGYVTYLPNGTRGPRRKLLAAAMLDALHYYEDAKNAE